MFKKCSGSAGQSLPKDRYQKDHVRGSSSGLLWEGVKKPVVLYEDNLPRFKTSTHFLEIARILDQ